MPGKCKILSRAQPIRRLLADRSGSIAVEAAITIVAMLAMLLPLLDFGGYIGVRLELKQALRAGGQYALEDYTNTTQIETVINNAASLKAGSITVAFDPSFCLCNDNTSRICLGDAGFTVCSDGVPAGRFLTTRASANFDPFFPFVPWFQPNMTVTEQLTLRVQ